MTTALKKKDSQELATTYDYGKYSGVGFDQDDTLDAPWMKLLQTNSSAVTNEEPNAKVGCFYNVATGENYGDEINVLIVDEFHGAFEFRPDMGGFAGEHSLDSEVWQTRIEDKFPKFKTKEGNTLTEGYRLTLLVFQEGKDPDPVNFTCDYYKAKEYKRLRRRMRMTKGSPPSFAFPLRFSVVPDKNPAGQTIKGLKIEIAGNLLPPDDTRFIAASAFREKLDKGLVTVDYDKNEGDNNEMENY